MSQETNQAKAARVRQIIAGLQQAYPAAQCELGHTNPLELLVATILSARCTDKQVNRVTPDLFKNYRTAADYALADRKQFQEDIKSLGFFHNKAKSIQACCRQLVERYQGQVPRTMAELTQLAGVGRKTANVILGNAFGLNEGIAVDTHVARLSTRLRLTSAKDPEKIEQALMRLVPKDQWTMFNHWLIWHGRRRCHARRPDCAGCEIRQLCPARQSR
jgi:endonuclease-3